MIARGAALFPPPTEWRGGIKGGGRRSNMNLPKQTPKSPPPKPAQGMKGSPERPGPVRPRCVCVYAHRSQSVPDTVFMTRTFPRRSTSLPGTIPDRTASFPSDLRQTSARSNAAGNVIPAVFQCRLPPGAASFSEVPAARPERTLRPSFIHLPWRRRHEKIAPLCTGKPDRRPARACHKGPADA